MAAEAQAGDSGTRWRATVSAEHRFHITRLLDKAHEQLVELRGAQSGTTAEVARTLLEHLRQSAELIDRAVLHTAACDLGGDRRGVGPAEVRAQVAGDVPVGTTGRVMAAVLVCILLTNSALCSGDGRCLEDEDPFCRLHGQRGEGRLQPCRRSRVSRLDR
jgi:hypothetical protein